MKEQTEDLRIRGVRPLLPPAILTEEIPIREEAARFVADTRKAVESALMGDDSRLVVVVGPCSIHDPVAAIEYGEKLKSAAATFSDELIVIMRAYFEKPRTTVGWKGLINDPDMDGTFHINKGLRTARRLLSDLTDMGVATGTEFLDTTIPQHIADYISWAAIGARTTESQTHREMASGLSMPVGFKNATDGDVQVSIDALKAAQQPHWFPGTTKNGISAIFQTTGNASCHVVLRGGTRTGPNYGREHVQRVSAQLQAAALAPRLMIDLSHGNSNKDPARQPAIAAEVSSSIEEGLPIFGVMLESNLVGGRQDIIIGRPLTYGQSVTDACLPLTETVAVMETLARSVQRAHRR